jgi:uncharacterized membrane protein YedE/YeeE
VLDSTLPLWIAGPVLGLAVVALLGLANRRFGVLGGVTDLVARTPSWRVLVVAGIVVGGALHAVLANARDAGVAYSWLDAHLSSGGEIAVLFAAGVLVGVGARTAGGCTSGHGITGSALVSPASLVSVGTMLGTAVATTFVLNGAL